MHREQPAPWDDDRATHPNLRDGSSRRHLLGAATGGLVLATSGLLLPPWLVEEAEAAEHPVRRVQHRAEKRRQRQHHHRKQRRRQRRHAQPAGQQPAPEGFFHGIEFTVRATGGSHFVQFYVNSDRYFLDTSWTGAGQARVSPGNPALFQTDKTFGALWIDDRYYLSAANVLPSGSKEQVGSGGHVDVFKGFWAPGQWWDTGSPFKETTQTIEGSRPVIFDTNWYVHFLRRPDSKDYYRFEVLLAPRA